MIPKIRFKDFFESFKCFKSYEIAEIKGSGVDKIIKENEIIGRIVNYTDVFHNVQLNEDYIFSKVSFSNKEYEKYNVKNGDILITPSSEDKIDIGLSSLINFSNTENLVYSYHLNLIRFKKECFPLYISYQLRIPRMKKYFFNVSQGVSRYTLSKKDFENMEIVLPSLKEQQKIANFFSLLDKQIELTKRKLELYDLKFKYYLNKMFCNENDKYPKLKFKEFINIGEWKNDFFSNIYKSFSCKKYMIYNKSLLQFSQKNNEKLVKVYEQGEERNVFSEEKNYLDLKKDNLILFGDHTRKIKIIFGKCLFYGDGIKLLNTSNNIFFFYLLLSKKIKSLGYSRHFKLLGDFDYFHPNESEQQKIANFFSLLDKQIELTKRKIELYNLKFKYYLNKMFC